MGAAYRASASLTTGAGSSIAKAITPAVGDYFLVACTAFGNTNDTPTCADDNGGAYVLVGTPAAFNASANRLSVFRRTTALPNTTSTTVTVTTGSATNLVLGVVAISGMVRFDASSIRSSGKTDNQTGAGPPAVTMNQAALTTNLMFGVVGSISGTFVEPSGWTERLDTTGMEIPTRDSGFTSATVTWTSGGGGGFMGVYAVELDASTIAAATGRSKLGLSSTVGF